MKTHRRTRITPIVLAAVALMGLWVSQASRPGNIEGCPVGCAQPADGRPSQEVRIASLNLLHDFPYFGYIPERLELVAREVEGMGADIICLQEVAWTPTVGLVARRLAERLDMNYLFLAEGETSELRVVEVWPAFHRPQRVGGHWLWPSDHVGLFAVLARW